MRKKYKEIPTPNGYGLVEDDEPIIMGRACPPNCQGVNRWISVKDKLPVDCSSYAIRSMHLICNDGFVTIGYFYPKSVNNFSVSGWSDAGGRDVTSQVSHWMPLPDPPKE